MGVAPDRRSPSRSCSPAARRQQLRAGCPASPRRTNHTGRIIGLWVTSWIVLLAVGVVTWGLIIWAAVVYRRRKGQTGLPVQLRYNMPIEIFYTIVPLILVLGFFAFTARDQAAIEETRGDPDVTIEVFGKRWAWDFNYVNEDVYSAGIQAQDARRRRHDRRGRAAGALPAGRQEGRDRHRVARRHPLLLDHRLPLQEGHDPGARPTTCTSSRTKEGTYKGKCAELCGEYHSLMLFKVKVVSQEEYDAYIESSARRRQRGPARRRVQHEQQPAGQRRQHDERGPERMSTATATRHPRRHRRAPSATAVGRAQGQRLRQVDHLDRPQDDRVPVPDHARSSTSCVGGVMALVIRAQLFAPGLEVVADQRAVQPAVHDARHDHAADVRDAAVRGLRQRAHAAADRCPRRRVPAPERLRLLAVHLRRAHRRRRLPHPAGRGVVRLVRLRAAVEHDVLARRRRQPLGVRPRARAASARSSVPSTSSRRSSRCARPA